MKDFKRSGKKTSNRKSRSAPRGKGPNYKDQDHLTDTGGQSKFDRDADSRDRRDYAKSKHNDPAWYAQNAQLLTDYASFPYGAPLGISLPPEIGVRETTAVPGVMALYYAPTIGIASEATSAINVAARNIYSFVRHANSGHSNYEAPDLMMYLVAMDSVYMMHSFLKRALGVVLDYSPLNRYYPRLLLEAMGLDPDSVMSNIADFRGFINQYAVKMGSMCVPNSMSYMARHSWMTEGIYTDSTAAKAQTYMYVPKYYYKLNVVNPGTDTALTQLARVSPWTPQQGVGRLSVSDICLFADQLLAPILANEDMNIMSGDILKAFGADGVVKVTGVLDGYMVLPVYSQEVLSQIENATILGTTLGTNDDAVTQDTTIGGGFLVSNDKINPLNYVNPVNGVNAYSLASYTPISGPMLLNMHHDNVTPADSMVATRLAARFTRTSSGPLPMAMGSEIVTSAMIYAFASDSASLARITQDYEIKTAMAINSDNSGGVVTEMVTRLALLANFDWAPIVYPMVVSAGETAGTVNTELPRVPFGDIDNYTILSLNNIQTLHETALLSEFSVPQMGAFSKSI